MSAPPVDSLADLRRRLELEEELQPFRQQRWTGRLGSVPTLYLDDFSDIPFLDVPGAEEYQHRARLRVEEGDLFAAVTAQSAGYEAYCRQTLGLGEARLVATSARFGPLEVARSCMEEPAFGELIDTAVKAGGLAIHPYMGIASVWQLGQRLAAAAKVRIEILAPPPPITWIANDKGTIGEVVETLLGSEWLVETESSNRPVEIASSLLRLSSHHDRVGLKRLRCASATGNKVFDSGHLQTLSTPQIEELVQSFLEHTEWDGSEEILIVAWETTEVSPSTQMWIPPPTHGPPRLDGIYEQILEGEEGTFVGSRPSALPERVNRCLGEAALTVAAGLQSLGYVGRCSFDHLILGDPQGDFRPVFTECNGRWGGTSIPMSLMDRLVAGPRPPYRAQDFMSADLEGTPFEEILQRASSHLFDPSSGQGTFIFYNVGPLAQYGKLDVISVASSAGAADEAMENTLPRLLGLSR